MQPFTPCLWFDSQAEEAANFYCSIFPNSRITQVTHYTEASSQASGQPAGSVMTVVFELDGKQFMGLNGGPIFKFTEAVSFMIPCKDQAQIDRIWDALLAGGQAQACGWLKDKYGLSWQIIPEALERLIEDSERGERVTAALMKMVKIDLPTLERAYEGETVST